MSEETEKNNLEHKPDPRVVWKLPEFIAHFGHEPTVAERAKYTREMWAAWKDNEVLFPDNEDWWNHMHKDVQERIGHINFVAAHNRVRFRNAEDKLFFDLKNSGS